MACFTRLLARGCVLLVRGMCVRRPGVASRTRRRSDLTPETQRSEEEEPNPVRAFAQLRRPCLGLVAVSHENPAWSRVPHPPAHASNSNGPGQFARNKLVSGPLGRRWALSKCQRLGSQCGLSFAREIIECDHAPGHHHHQCLGWARDTGPSP